MKVESILRLAEHYDKRVKEIEEEAPHIENSFRHIASNLLTTIVGHAQLAKEMPESWKKYKKIFVADMNSLRTYLRLLDNDPEFRHDELTQEDGYFPDIDRMGKDFAKNYVEEATSRLEG